MTSYIWRSSAGQENVSKQGTRAAATTDVITFSASNVANGKYIHQSQFDMVVAIGDNENPGFNVNELQDTGVDSMTWILTGSVGEIKNNDAFQTIKTWMLDNKTDSVFTKGRFGLELDDILAYNLIPTGAGATPEQARGYIITNWIWLRDGETNGKAEFVATLRFSGDPGVNTTSPKYSWIVNH